MSEASPLISETPLPANRFAFMERAALAFILSVTVLFIGALAGAEVAPGNGLTEVVETYFLDPHSTDSTAGDADYNTVDTVAYSLLLVSFVILLSAWLRHLGVAARDSTILAMLPWVLWAAIGEVNEDAGLFASGMGEWFVSPLIHFHIAAWVIGVGWMSHRAASLSEIESRTAVTQLSFVLVFLQTMIFLPQFSQHWTLSLTSPMLWAPIIGLMLVVAIHPLLECCSSIEQGLLQVGIGGCVIQLGGWLMMYTAPLAGMNPISLWPMALVLCGPLLIIIPLYFYGRQARDDLHHMGLSPGIIPEGITIDDWERQNSSTFERLEALSPRAVLGLPLVLLAMYGQMVDGLATSVGVEWFGYSEKHVLSEDVIQLANSAYGFGALKFVLAGLVWWIFASARFEHRHRHLRLLVLLCLLVVGLAPGLRDVLRMTLSV
jgi:uncharacterized membrane protein